MTVRVGGINISIGIDGSKLIQGLEVSKTQLANFQRAMTKIRLEGAIKGDPFSSTRDYLKRAKKEIGSVFDSFSTYITKNTKDFDRYAEASRKLTNGLVRDWQKVQKQIDILGNKKVQEAIGKFGQNQGEYLRQSAIIKTFRGDAKESALKGTAALMPSFDNEMLEDLKGFDINLDRRIKSLQKTIDSGKGVTGQRLYDFFNRLKTTIATKTPEVEAALEAMGRKIKQSFERQPGLEFGSKMSTLSSEKYARGTRADKIRELRVEQAKLNSQISIGYNVEANRNRLLDIYNEKKKLGLELSVKQVATLIAEEKRLEAQTRTTNYNLSERGRISDKESLIRGGLAFKSQVSDLSTGSGALINRIAKTKELILAEAKLTGELRLGMNVEANRGALMDIYQRKQKLGLALTQKQAEYVKQYRIEQSKANYVSRFEQQQMAGITYRAQLGDAGNTTQARLRRVEVSRKLTIEQAMLNAQVKIGMNVEANSIAILRNKIKMLDLYGKDTRAAREELRKLIDMQKLDPQAKTGGGFLSASWFKQRASWFLQLRGYWAIYRGLSATVASLVEYETQLSRAMRTSNSEFKDREEIHSRYSVAMREAIVTHATDWKKPAEVLYQLTSAGLSSEEALAGLNSTMSLLVGTEGDATEVTKGVAGIYNNFKDSITSVTSASEKLNYINDLIAVTWKNHQVEIGELIDGYKQSSAMAKAAGTSIEELTALIALANDHMIKGGQAGRALTNVFMRISRTPRLFAETFGVVIDYDKPLKLVEIMEQLSKKISIGSVSVAELSDAFERMGIRGGPIFTTLLQHWDEYGRIMVEQSQLSGVAASIEAERLDNLSDKWKRFTSSIAASVAQQGSLWNILTTSLKYYLDLINIAQKRNNIEAQGQSLVGDLFYRKNLKEPNSLKSVMEDSKKELKGYIEWINKTLESGYKDFPEYREKLTPSSRIKLQVEREKAAYLLRLPTTEEVIKKKEEEREEKAVSREERLYRIRHLQGTAAENLIYLNDRLIEQQERRNKLEGDLADPKKGYAAKQKILKEDMVILDNEDKVIQTEIDEITKREIANYKESARFRQNVTDQEKDSLDRQIRMLELEKQGNDLKIKTYKLETLTADESEAALDLAKENFRIENEINRKKYIKSRMGQGIGTGEEEKIYRLGMFTNQDTFKGKSAEITEARRKSEEKELSKALRMQIELNEEQVLIAEEALLQAQIEGKTKQELLALELAILEIRKNGYELNAELVKNTKTKYQDALNKISKTTLEIKQNAEDTRREYDMWYDLFVKIRDKSGTMKDMWRGILGEATDTITSGVSTVAFDLTGGFQKQRQEVINLQQELKGLQESYEAALAEGNIDQAKQLNQQMAELNKKIKELKDPIKQVGDAFHDLFKDIVDGIRKAIIEWLTMKAVMGIIKSVGDIGGAGTGYRGELGGEGFVPYTPKAHGGILPNIKSFQKFSRGGVTGGATMALLGDNKSGKEIIIPTENISDNNVSGYMSEGKQPVYIANFFTPEDLMQGLASAEGGKIVVNHVLRDRQDNGRKWGQV